MLKLQGTYFKGKVHLEKIIPTDYPLKVTVVFEDDVDKAEPKKLKFSDFSFTKSRMILKNKEWSFSDTKKILSHPKWFVETQTTAPPRSVSPPTETLTPI